MAVQLTGSQGLFSRLGKIGATISAINAAQSTTVSTDTTDLAAQFPANQILVDSLFTQLSAWQAGQLGYASYLQGIAEQTVIEMVNADNPQPDLTLTTALTELFRQMVVGGEGVAANSETVSVIPYANNNSNAVVAVSLKEAEGRTLQNIFGENVILSCVTDAQTGGATAGLETWQALGQYSEANPLNYDWPRGSGCSATVQAVTPTISGGSNLINNGMFGTTPATFPTQAAGWSYDVGANLIEIAVSAALCGAESALWFLGDGSTHTQISQQFGNANGSTALSPLSQYALHFQLGGKDIPATNGGTLEVALVDGYGNYVHDHQGSPNAYSIQLSSLVDVGQYGTDIVELTHHADFTNPSNQIYCSSVPLVFRTPRVMPSTIKLRLRLTQPLPSVSSIQFSQVAMTVMNELYSFGPSIAVFSGQYSSIQGDKFTLEFTNNRAGQWQTLLQRLFGLNDLRLFLPISGEYVGTNNQGIHLVPDSLISG